MATFGSVEYRVVVGTVAGIATFNTAVETQVNLGYVMLTPATVDATGVNITQVMIKGAASSITQSWPIAIAPTVGAAGAGAFTLAGNVVKEFVVGFRFSVVGSTGNDKSYTVLDTPVFGGANTVILVKEAVPSAVVDGTILQYAP